MTWPYPGDPASRSQAVHAPVSRPSSPVGPVGRALPSLDDQRSIAEWDRAADARRDAWLASPFADAFRRLAP